MTQSTVHPSFRLAHAQLRGGAPTRPSALRLACALLVCALLLACARSAAPDTASPSAPAVAPADADAGGIPAATKLRLASSVWAPFTDEVGKPRFAQTLVHQALERAGVAFEASLIQFPGVLPALREGRIDGSEALWKSAEREEYLLFSNPYLENRLVLLGRYGTDVSAKRLADLAGRKVGIVRDYAYGPALEEAPGVELVRDMGEPELLRKLLKQEVDLILVDELLVYQLFQAEATKAEALLAAGQHPILTQGLHLALRRDVPGAATVLQRFNAVLRELARDGTYHRILAAGWIATDVDNDGRYELLPASSELGTAPPAHHYRLFGANTSLPRFVVEGRAYEDWQSVPERYKVPPKEGLDRFQPAFSLVLAEF